MTSPANPDLQPTPTPAGDDRSWARTLYAREIALLGELAEAGLAVAVAIKDQVVAGQGDAIALSNAYAKVARAVRMAILLQSKLIKQLQDWDAQTAAQAVNATAVTQADRDAQAAKHKAERERDYAEHVERLASESAGRLDRDDIYALVNSRPVSELITMICQDLGLDPDWLHRTQEALAEQATSDGGGSSFKALIAADLPPGPGSGQRALGRPPDPH